MQSGYTQPWLRRRFDPASRRSTRRRDDADCDVGKKSEAFESVSELSRSRVALWVTLENRPETGNGTESLLNILIDRIRMFLPGIQRPDAFFSSDPEQSVEHASVADLHALRLALDLEPGFGQINREGTWNIYLSKDFMSLRALQTTENPVRHLRSRDTSSPRGRGIRCLSGQSQSTRSDRGYAEEGRQRLALDLEPGFGQIICTHI